jgi:hypothetical protein
MAKKAIKRSYEELYVLIKNHTALNTRCRNVLRKILSNEEIQIEQITNGDKLIYSIAGGKGTPVVANESRYWAVPLLTSTDGSFFWLNFSITFQKVEEISSIAFLGTSIRIFKGMGYSQSKDLIFRAEWDANKEVETHHEQPHWHVYPQSKYYLNNSPLAKDFVSLIEEDENTSKFVDSLQDKKESEPQVSYLNKFDLTDFHFAMSAQWHVESSQRAMVKETELPKWLEGTVNYIISQLHYLTKH